MDCENAIQLHGMFQAVESQNLRLITDLDDFVEFSFFESGRFKFKLITAELMLSAESSQI